MFNSDTDQRCQRTRTWRRKKKGDVHYAVAFYAPAHALHGASNLKGKIAVAAA
jgi:hypothetical protein